jgi:hypothetical protein
MDLRTELIVWMSGEVKEARGRHNGWGFASLLFEKDILAFSRANTPILSFLGENA